MKTRMWLWVILPGLLLLSGCPDGGGGTGGFEGVPLALQAYLKASNTGTSDSFGQRVAIDGDTLVIGAPNESSNAIGVGGNQADNSAVNAGAVYVFVRVGGIWSQQAYIKASNTGAGDGFGSSVAISGNTLVVGATGEDSNAVGVNPVPPAQTDNSALESGAVYVFLRSAGVWSQQAYIKASNTEASDGFGGTVAISGDTLAIGATGEDSNATTIGGNQGDNSAAGSGAVYVFLRSGTTWSQQAYVKASNAEGGDAFGTSVGIAGDTLVVGATGEDGALTGVTAGSPNEGISGNAASNSGAVYVFTRSGITWSQQAYLKASNTDIGDNFGSTITIDGDALAIGAIGEDSNLTGITAVPPNDATTGNLASDSGAVYIFSRSAGAWSQDAYVKASNTGTGDAFGTRVALSNGLLAVGAPGEASALTTVVQGSPNEGVTGNGAVNAGAVYAFTNAGGGWSQQTYVKAPNAESGDGFGTSVAVSGDTLVVGATGEDGNATGVGGDQADNSLPGAGAAYVFR